MKQNVIFFFGFFTLFIYLSYFLQTTLLLSPDVSYLMHASQQLLQGGHYGKEIFETNPPMILYLYAPIHFFNIMFHDVIFTLRFYVLILAAISSAISYILLKKLIADPFYRQSIFFTLLFVLFILPIYAFGQREHLLMIFIFPYVLNKALTLEKKPISSRSQFCIGIMAGLGFALKPFFLAPFLLIEAFAYQRRRDILPMDCLAILLVFVCYLVSIYIWQPDYLQIILPFTFKYYFIKHSVGFAALFFAGRAIFAVFCLAMLISYLVFYRNDRNPIIGRLFFLALLGMLIAYVIPQQPWYYHLYPAIGFSFLLLAHVLSQVFNEKNILLSGIVLAICGIFPLYQCYYLLVMMQKYKMTRPQNAIVKYINQTKGERSIYCFALFTSDCFPLVDQVKGQYAAKFPAFWWFAGMRIVEKENKISPQFLKDKNFFIEQIGDDLNTYQARWIIINEGNFQFWEGGNFNIMQYFSDNKNFKTAMQPYSFVKKIKGYAIYERIQ